MKQNKYTYLLVIQCNYAGYWEDVSKYDQRTEYKDWKREFKEYCFMGYPTRTVKRRVLNDINERAIIKEVNKRVPKNAQGMSNHILRIKAIRDMSEHFHNLEIGEQVSLLEAKHFADKHWTH